MRFYPVMPGRLPLAVFIPIVIFAKTATLLADAGQSLEIGNFSASIEGGAFPSGWKPLIFKKIKQHTRYSLVKEDGDVVVKAESISSSSGLIRKVRIDPVEYPFIEWRWKATTVFKNGNITQKDGDDYPARLYITFEYDPSRLSFLEKAKYEAARLFHGEYPPVGAINYIWASNAPKGTVVPNTYTGRVMMIVVESGKSGLNSWIHEKRNIVEDYQKAFGEKPPVISGVAIMTDTDNTKESAVTYYGDILFRKK